MSLLHHEDNDDPAPGEEIDSGDMPILIEALVILIIILACTFAISGCGGSTTEDDEKSLQPVPCAQDRKTCV